MRKCTGKLIILMLVFLNFGSAIRAQQQDSGIVSTKTDTTANFLDKLRKFGKEETVNSIQKYQAGRLAMQQEKTLQGIRQASERAKILLRSRIDTSSYIKDLAQTKIHLLTVQDGIFINRGTEYTTRNLTVSANILNELLLKTTAQRNTLRTHISELVNVQDQIDSLSADSSLYTFPGDSIQTIAYLKKLTVVARELGPADTALRHAVGLLQQLQTDLDMQVFEIRSKYEDIERLRHEKAGKIFEQEFPYLWETRGDFRPFPQIIHFSAAKEKLALGFYVKDYTGRILILILLITSSWYFLRSLKEKWVLQNEEVSDYKGLLVIRYPLLSAMLIVISIFQFIFLKPPFIFSFCLWFISACCLSFIFRGYITRFWMKFWLIVICFFVLGWTDNMILQASRIERWFMLILSLSGAIYNITMLRRGHRKELKEKGITVFVVFVVVMETAALITNIAGRYNLSKTLMVTGFAGILIAILFLWTVRMINEGLAITSKVYKHPERKLFYLNFTRIGDRAPGIFYFFLIVGWFILVSRNFYAYEQATIPFTNFLNTERTLGNYTFTINSLFIFIVILVIATILSQIISFFANDNDDQRNKNVQERKPGLGSWLLLIRIFILSVGIFLAFAAAGIPLDRLTIILGALGVGIGLGLQGLVSNLVSGLIIAFEKPVNVGDQIEINGKPGMMQSIGFRSSVVNLAEGACLIIPNSDLLSQHLINWSMGRSSRRINISLGVAYGTDLKKAKEILQQILDKEERILSYPHPQIAPKSFQSYFVEFELLFWMSNYSDIMLVKGDIITAIEETFMKENIVISLTTKPL